MQLIHSPRSQTCIDQISKHFTIGVHGQDGAIVSYQGGVAFFKEKAEVSVLETKVVGAIEMEVISQMPIGGPETRDS